MSNTTTPKSALQEKYLKTVVPTLQKEFGLKNALEAPKMVKVVVNVGVGRHLKDEKFVNSVFDEITRITGQRPVRTKARKAIAAFKLREGNVVGVAVTLRGRRMYDFIEKLVSVALARVRDFRGLQNTGFDEHGNYSLGLREHVVFPEVSSDAHEHTFPLEITVVTTARTAEQGRKLLAELGFPFQKEGENQ